MKTITRITLFFLVLGMSMVMLGACAPAATPVSNDLQPTTTPDIMIPVNMSRFAEEAAIQALQTQSGIDRAQIRVITTHEVNWPDACLGNPTQGVTCAQVITPGYLIVLNANGQSYEFHTNRDGKSLVRVTGDKSLEKTVVLSWQRDGGIAGFCDEVTVYSDGTVQISSCKGVSREVTLTAEQATQLEQMHTTMGPFESNASDAAQADAMTITLRFFGKGTQPATQADEQTLSNLVTALMAIPAQNQ